MLQLIILWKSRISNRAGASDVDKAKFELELINNILAEIPHKVEYKPYFAKDILVKQSKYAKLKKKIFINENEIDLRYITKIKSNYYFKSNKHYSLVYFFLKTSSVHRKL